MKFYTKQHEFYCGIDLHARKMYVCILDYKGDVRKSSNKRSLLALLAREKVTIFLLKDFFALDNRRSYKCSVYYQE